MSQPDIEDRPDLNTGNPWSEMDLFDLANCVRLKQPVEEIAGFMCRSRREVREKIAELEQTDCQRCEGLGGADSSMTLTVSVLARGGISAVSARRPECPIRWSPARA